MRIVKLVDRNAEPVRFCCDLGYRVEAAAVVFAAVFCRQDKESVSKVDSD